MVEHLPGSWLEGRRVQRSLRAIVGMRRRKNGLRSNNPFYGDFFKVNARGDRLGPDEERGSTLANWSDHVKGFLVALRGPPGDPSWNNRFADVGILNMMAGAKVESGEPLSGPCR